MDLRFDVAFLEGFIGWKVGGSSWQQMSTERILHGYQWAGEPGNFGEAALRGCGRWWI